MSLEYCTNTLTQGTLMLNPSIQHTTPEARQAGVPLERVGEWASAEGRDVVAAEVQL
jgi:hypothetical protein